MTNLLPSRWMPQFAVLTLALVTPLPVTAAEGLGARGESLLPSAALVKPLPPKTHPLAGTIGRFLDRQERYQDFQPTGLKRDDYLKVIAGQVNVMRGYQNAEGRIIDPVGKAEMYYSTPCYAHAVAALAAGGFAADPGLLESGMKAMDVSTADMARGDAAGGHGDFFIYPLMMAFQLYAKVAPAERVATWRENLRRIEPRKVYRAYGGKGNNWTIVNLSGDYPMLIFDGLQKTQIQMHASTLELSLDGKGLRFEVLEPAGVTLQRSSKELDHRNGIVEPVYADIPGQTVAYRIQAR